MGKFVLYIAVSLDGYIARENGSVDWLDEIPNPNQIDHGYSELLNRTRSIIMGRKTYEEILGFGVEWPYSELKTYVATTKTTYHTKTPETFTIPNLSSQSLEMVKSSTEKDVWVVGGGELITSLMHDHGIEEMILSIIPIILGKGRKLFADFPPETRYALENTQAFETGIVNLTYRKI